MAYSKRQLPDTPWHIGYAYKDAHDPRRHKTWCIHLENKICKCGMSGCYMTHCAGSSHCKYYAEEQSQWDEYVETMKTEEEKNEETAENRAALYRKEKRDFVRSQLASCTYNKRYRFRPAMLECPFCHERMKELKCQFCLAKFKVVPQLSEDAMKTAAEEGYFLIQKV